MTEWKVLSLIVAIVFLGFIVGVVIALYQATRNQEILWAFLCLLIVADIVFWGSFIFDD